MIWAVTPNILTKNFSETYNFYSKILGLWEAVMLVNNENNDTDKVDENTVFAIFEFWENTLFIRDLDAYNKDLELENISTWNTHLYFIVDDLNVHITLLEKNSISFSAPKQTPYGMTEIIFEDNIWNIIILAQDSQE